MPTIRAGRLGSPARVVVVASAVLLLAFPTTGAHHPALGPPVVAVPPPLLPGDNATGCSLINYTSTVDGFPLSYTECLPTGFENISSYPVALDLHGLSSTQTTPQPGGYLTTYNVSWVPIFARAGYLLEILNTRTGSGFYVNSPYTGPQEQDVWDALASIERRHAVASLSVFGSSMGSMGAWSLVGHHPGVFRNLGAVLSFSDYYQAYAYSAAQSVHGPSETETLLASIANGSLPNASALAASLFGYLSAPRFAPENYSGVRMYIVHGGNDQESPNNPAFWPYQQSNATVLQSTCLVADTIAEPSNCTEPLLDLAALHPGAYAFRYVYEPDGVHTDDELDVSDMLDFWAGAEPTGVYWATPSTEPVAPPAPIVGFATVPDRCGSFTVDGATFLPGDATSLAAGLHPVSATPCAGLTLRSLTADGASTLNATTGVADVTGETVFVAVFGSPEPVAVTGVSSLTACAGPTINGTSLPSGGSIDLLSGTYPVAAINASGCAFLAWSAAGGISVAVPTMAATTITVTSAGTLTVEWASSHSVLPTTYSVVVAVSPATCTSGVTINGTPYGNGSVALLGAGAYALGSDGCAGLVGPTWTVSGLVTLGGGTVTVAGNGTVGAAFSAPAATSATTPDSASIEFLLAGAVVGLAALLAVVWVVVRRPPARSR